MSDKKLLSRIAELESQNKKLRRELSKYKKYAAKSVDSFLDNYANCKDKDEFIEKKKTIVICEHCGKGETNRVVILDFKFDVCPICGFRKKIK